LLVASKSPLLGFGNVRKAKDRLASILNAEALLAIESEIENNVNELYALALTHYRFAKRQPASQWRQKTSRLYYAAYNASRATRLYVHGEFSTDASDHKQVGKLPDGFPNRSTYSNQLGVLRSDRNLADYDHLSRAADLTNPVSEHTQIVRQYLDDVRDYLSSKGIELRGNP